MTAPRVARRHVEALLCEHEYCGDLPTLMLLVSEVVTNAVMHAAPPFVLEVSYRNDRVRVGVENGTTARLPRIRAAPDDASVGGHGLRLVDALSGDWGCAVHDDNTKTVWFTLDD